jgi:trk system potassium uptake protein
LSFVKNSTLEFKRIVHPRAVVPLKINGERVTGKVITHIMNFFTPLPDDICYGESIVMSIAGYDMITAFGAVATSLGNVGPAIGRVGPMDNFAFFIPLCEIISQFFDVIG